MDFLELAKQRYSERFFDSRPIEQEKLDRIIEAGRIVPTACNYQPQRFYLIRSKVDPAKLNALIFDQFQSGYYVAGEKVGKAWNAGKDLMTK